MGQILENLGKIAQDGVDMTRRTFIKGTLIGLAALQFGCTALTSKHEPNLPYQGTMPPSYNILAQENPLFAEELLKIPDIRDGVTEKEAEGIDRLVKSYTSMQPEYDRAFEFIYQVGKPEVRPYNSGVETLFWIFEKGDNIQEAEWIIEDYKKSDNLSLARTFMNIDLEGLMNLGWDLYDEERWGDIDLLKARLNAPEVLSYYTHKALSYQRYNGNKKSINNVIKTSSANCYDTSFMLTNLLQQSGYDAKMFLTDSIKSKDHTIMGFRDKGKFFLIDNGRPSPRGIIGPFESYKEGPYNLYYQQIW